MVQNGSPGSGVVTQIITPHWQNQLLKCEVSVPNFVGVGALRSRERFPLLLCCSGEALFGAVKRVQASHAFVHSNISMQTTPFSLNIYLCRGKCPAHAVDCLCGSHFILSVLATVFPF